MGVASVFFITFFFVKDQLLLVGHQFGKEDDKLFWSFPGGGVDFGETLQEAIVREFKEETGLTVTVGSFLFIYEYIGSLINKSLIAKLPNAKEITSRTRIILLLDIK